MNTRDLRTSANLAQNRIRPTAEFRLSDATDEADFEARRGVLRQATIDFYDLEEQRMAGLQLVGSEQELAETYAKTTH